MSEMWKMLNNRIFHLQNETLKIALHIDWKVLLKHPVTFEGQRIL